MEQFSFQLFVGIDVAARTFSVAWTSNGNEISTAYEFEQNQKGIKDFLTSLR